MLIEHEYQNKAVKFVYQFHCVNAEYSVALCTAKIPFFSDPTSLVSLSAHVSFT